jgi:hypothetical protein
MQISLTVFSRSWSQLAEAVCSSLIGQPGILLHISGRLFETIVDNPAGSIAWPSGGPFDGIAGIATGPEVLRAERRRRLSLREIDSASSN